MRSRTVVYAIDVMLTASACFAIPEPSLRSLASAAEPNKADVISGEWNATFAVEGMKVPFKFKFTLEGDKVTGTADSQHTGAGTLSKGSWSGEKLSSTMDFAEHESIAVTGTLGNNNVAGESVTEGRKGRWTAELLPELPADDGQGPSMSGLCF